MAQKDWFAELAKSRPKQYPHLVERSTRSGKETYEIQSEDEYRAALEWAEGAMPEPMRRSIYREKTPKGALAELCAKLEASGFFKHYRKTVTARLVRAERLTEYRARQREAQEEIGRRKRTVTLARMQSDIEALHVSAADQLDDPDVDASVLLDLARSAGSIHTRLRQLYLAAERRQLFKKERPED